MDAGVIIGWGVLLIVAALLYYKFGTVIKERIQAGTNQKRAGIARSEVESLERSYAIEYARATQAEQIEADKAALARKAAEDKVQALVVADTRNARVEAELQVIAAQAEGRAAAAKERALAGASGMSSNEAKLEAYRAYCEGRAAVGTTPSDIGTWAFNLASDFFD